MALYDNNLTFFKSNPGQAVTATAVSELTYDMAGQPGAVDNGSGTISGLTFTPYITSGSITLAQLIANLAQGWNQIAEFDLPRRPIGTPLPRFLQIQYVPTGTFTGLNLKGYIGLGDSSAEDTMGQYAANF